MTASDRRRIAAAIAQAEDGTTGRIAVRVIPDGSVDALERAEREFDRIGLAARQARNAALVLIAPNARGYAVIGDRSLHERVGDDFWKGVVAEMQPFFAREDVTGGVLLAVERIGSALHAHFSEEPES